MFFLVFNRLNSCCSFQTKHHISFLACNFLARLAVSAKVVMQLVDPQISNPTGKPVCLAFLLGLSLCYSRSGPHVNQNSSKAYDFAAPPVSQSVLQSCQFRVCYSFDATQIPNMAALVRAGTSLHL